MRTIVSVTLLLLAVSFAPQPRATGIADLDATQAIAETFGQTSSAMYVFDDVFTAAKLAELKAFAKGCTSFFSLPTIVSHEEETEVRDLVEALPTTDGEAKALQRKVLAHPNGPGELVSRDGRSVLVICPDVKEGPRVDPRAVHAAFQDDLRLGAGLFLLLATLAYFAAKRAGFPLWATLIVLALVGQLWAHHTTLGQLLGPRASALLSKLASVTEADNTTLIAFAADANTHAGVSAIAAECAKHARVRCPTDSLKTMSEALTGKAELPANDEQLKALWFFSGERAELRLVFGPEKKSALIRVQGEPEVGAGLPSIDLGDFALPFGAVALLAFVLAWLLRAALPTSVGVLVGAVAIPPAIFAYPVALAGTAMVLASWLRARQAAR